MITQLFSGVDGQIATFCAAFDGLRENFKLGVNLDTALVLSRTTATVNAISMYSLLKTTVNSLIICVQDMINCCHISNLRKCPRSIDKCALKKLD